MAVEGLAPPIPDRPFAPVENVEPPPDAEAEEPQQRAETSEPDKVEVPLPPVRGPNGRMQWSNTRLTISRNQRWRLDEPRQITLLFNPWHRWL